MCIHLRRAAWILAAVSAVAPAPAGEPPDGDGTKAEPAPVSRVERPTEGLPAGAILCIGERRFRHGDGITALAFAEDGRTLYSAGKDAAVRAWEHPSGRERFAIRLTDGQSVDDLILSPGGSRLVAACGGGAIVEWGSADGALLRKTASEQALTRLVCTPDGRHLLTAGNDGTLFVRNAETCETIRPLKAHADEVCRPAVSPDGTRIYSGGDDRKVRAWDLATGTLLGTWTEHADTVTAAVVSPDGLCLATGDDAGVLFLRDPDSGRIRRRIAWESESVAALAFSPDSGHLAVATAQGIHLVSVPSGEITQTLVCPGEGFTVLAFAPRGDVLAAAVGNRILFWDLAPGPVMIERRFGALGDGVISIAVSQDGLRAAVQTQDRGIVMWDIAADREIRRIDQPAAPPLVLAFSPDGACLVGAGPRATTLTVWDAATGDARRTLDTEGHPLRAFELVPGGHRLAVSLDDGRVLLWDVVSGARVTDRKVQENPAVPVTLLKAFPDGSSLLVASADGSMDVVRLPTLERLLRLAKCDEAVSAMAFSPDGRRFVTGDVSGNVQLWSVADGRRLFEGKDRLNGSGIAALAFVPGEDRFISLSHVSEEPWALWDPGKPGSAEPETFRGGTGETDMACVLTDGRIVTGKGGVSYLSLWRPGVARRARARAPQGFDKPFDRVLFSADGRTLVAEGQDAKDRGGFLSFFDAGSGQATGATSASGSALLHVSCPPDGGVAAVFQDGRLRSWSLPGGGLVADLEVVRGDALMAAAISADGRRVVAATEEKMIHWDVPGRRTLREFEVTPKSAGSPTSLECPADGLSVVRFLANNRIDAWDLATGLKTVDMPIPGLSGLESRLMPDGATILMPDHRAAETGVQVVDIATRKSAARLKAGSGNRVALAIRPDGAAVATAADVDGIAIWEPWTGTRLHAFDRTSAAVVAMAFSPDGRRLAAACADETFLVFDVSPWAGDPLPGIPATHDGLMEDWAAMGRDAEDATGNYQAMARMAGRGDGAVRFLADRMQAAPAAPDRLPRWLRELDDEAVEVRERAMEEMKGLGPESEPALREARERVTSPEVANRLDRILLGLAGRPPSEEGLRRVRAVRVLGRIGTEAARRALAAVETRGLYREEARAARLALARLASRRP
jgi:WD40 repeat protein